MNKLANNVVAAVLGLSVAVAGQNAFAGEVCFDITQIKSNEGKLMINILGSEAEYNDDAAAIASIMIPAQKDSVSVCVDAFNTGFHGIRVFHDVDNDGELASNLVGMPTEPWGMSNNAKGSFGPPSWDDMKFEVTESGAKQSIQLNH